MYTYIHIYIAFSSLFASIADRKVYHKYRTKNCKWIDVDIDVFTYGRWNVKLIHQTLLNLFGNLLNQTKNGLQLQFSG